jgi:hypothetical protein
MIHKIKKMICYLCFSDDYEPNDCTAIHGMSSSLPSGLYQVKLPVIGHISVLCEMEVDGGGWTVIVSLTSFFFHYIDRSTKYLLANTTYNEVSKMTSCFFSLFIIIFRTIQRHDFVQLCCSWILWKHFVEKSVKFFFPLSI